MCCAATGTGVAAWICPVDQPCACPTKQTGRNPFDCYNPSQYSCSTTSPNWPQSGLIKQLGISDAGACGSARKLVTAVYMMACKYDSHRTLHLQVDCQHRVAELCICFLILSTWRRRNLHVGRNAFSVHAPRSMLLPSTKALTVADPWCV